MKIVKYAPGFWEDLQKVHDPARMQELTLAGLEAAFLPLTVAAEREDLFDYQLYVAVEENVAVGFVAFTEDELAWLYVRPDHQRKGIARALCDGLEQGAKGEGVTRMTVHASITARGFFEKRGWRVVKEQQVERKGILLTNFVMEKAL